MAVNIKKMLGILNPAGGNGNCHGETSFKSNGLRKLAIVGNPNVGKSLIFNTLTGAHATVSNYPGTTVNVSRGKMKIGDEEFQVVDTPGMYSLLPISEEERVARSILIEEKPDIVIHAVDAKNLERMLPLTLQLIEWDLPVVLDLNMMDETEAAGININIERLENALGIPVVATIATKRHGMTALKARLADYVNHNCPD